MGIFDTIADLAVVPVISIDDADRALPLADALMEGGLPVAEVTFRTPAAAQAIANISRHRPEMLIGAGTVVSEEQVDIAADAGARFALSPGLDRGVLDSAANRGLPFAPGIATASDLQSALKAGCRLVKFFPAMAAGGPQMLNALAAPFLHTGIGYNPTGGVNLDNIEDWLAIAPVRAVGGTWIATQADVADGNWDAIAAKAAAAVARVNAIRRKPA